MLAGLSIVTSTTKPAAKNEATVIQIGITVRLILIIASKIASSAT